MGCGEQESLDESFAVTVVQYDLWFRKRTIRHPVPKISGPCRLPVRGGRREGVTLVIGTQDGRAAAFPSVLAQVRSGATSEHDEGGDHALARGAESSDRRTRLSQANADRTLFRGLRLSCAKNRRRSGRPHARDGGCEDQGRREDAWFRRAGFRVLRFPDELIIGGLPIVSSTFVRRCARHELLFCEARQATPPGCGKQERIEERLAVTLVQSDRDLCSGPHPIRRFGHLPQQAGEGESATSEMCYRDAKRRGTMRSMVEGATENR